MAREGMADGHALEQYFLGRLTRILEANGKRPAVWNEAIEGGELARSTRVHGWESVKACLDATTAGYRTVVMPGQYFYFDMRQSPHEDGHDWAAIFDVRKTYSFDFARCGFTPAQEARRQFDVNFFGMVNMNRAVLPIMRQQGGGRIVNMSSVAAPIAIPFQAYYSASKAAVRTYSLALASEVRPFGIEVCVIMPGDIATGFTAARRKSCDGDVVYHGRIARSVAVMEHDEQTGMSAEYAGQFVARRATQKRAKLICTMGHKYALFVFLMRILPTGLATRIVGKIYAS